MLTNQADRPRPGLVRLARGCWLPAERAGDLLARCAAAVSSSADDTVIVGTTAARLHRLWLPDDGDDVIHLATAAPAAPAHAMTRTRRPEFRGHRRQLPRDDIVLLDGLPVTTPARTWRDLACLLPVPDVVAAGDCVLRAGTTLDELVAIVARTSRSRHVRIARTALGLLDPRSRSRPESHLRVAVSAPDMPPFDVNKAVSRRTGGWLAEPDLSLPEARLALEYQGIDHAEPTRMRRDLTRAADMRHEGWSVLSYGPAEVFGRPWQIAAEVRAAIRERAPHLLRRPRVVTCGSSGHV